MNKNRNENYCDCVSLEEVIKPTALARAYVPFQTMCSIHTDETGLIRGTIFPELYSPYCKGMNKVKDC